MVWGGAHFIIREADYKKGGDADSCRAPDLNSGWQGSVNVHRGALLLVQQ